MIAYAKIFSGVAIFGTTTGAIGGGLMAYIMRDKKSSKVTTAVNILESSLFGGMFGMMMPWLPLSLYALSRTRYCSMSWDYTNDTKPVTDDLKEVANING